jgi:hypothetical protein
MAMAPQAEEARETVQVKRTAEPEQDADRVIEEGAEETAMVTKTEYPKTKMMNKPERDNFGKA